MNKYVGNVAVLVAVMSGEAVAQLAPPNPASQRPTVRTPNCTTGGCHADQIGRKFLHGPNAVQACDACHQPADLAQHTFELKRNGRELCDFCHIDKTGTEGPVVHKPVADGQCLSCHDPHGASNRRMLKRDTTPQLCLDCHNTINSSAHIHKPSSEDCAACHKPHTSDHPHLLIAEQRSLCLSCHEDVGKSVAGSKHPHDPAKGDCLQCHDPHSTDNIKALVKSPSELCVSCHQKIADIAAHAVVPHSSVLGRSSGVGARACLNCHTAHASEHEKQLFKDPTTSCLECHAKPIEVAARSDAGGEVGQARARIVGAVAELSSTTLHRHGPIENAESTGSGGCSGCHDVHGGDRPHLLTGNYSPSFYQRYTDQAYELCFKCHNPQLVAAQPATDQTGFRDGSRNLHAVHVGTGGGQTQGRNCRSCHSIHASKFKAQISETVPFGQWKLPINFAQSETGGSCSPGCHKPETYDRTRFNAVSPSPAIVPAPGAPSQPDPGSGLPIRSPR